MQEETILFNEIIFGPVKSRRLGLSLGVNLLPTHYKICNFNCIYCECGFNVRKHAVKNHFQPASVVRARLEECLIDLLKQHVALDAITFAGNGEPTLHPEFPKIINDTLELRDLYFPAAKVAVLSNATMLNHTEVVEALRKVDLRIMKLDAGTEDIYQQINQPNTRRYLSWIVDHLQYFRGNLIIQSMFIRGEYQGKYIDNTSDENVNAWLELLKIIKPKQVMIYSLDRTPAAGTIEKIEPKKLDEIAYRVRELGIGAMVY